ncbi:2-hydroxyacid dehydrogenase [Mycobacterium sp. Aquia_213]|uniref:2-hydroxyacid dehydrogenase n=1 Tax=Mycobacterium sp. Aquia_213 TaxID=2991728 RepID=UPI0022710727|nr:2-hydroxyacid dehydrogenase [Mycobacterium sp. Aquia_213]WAC91219.1 2-hydroxyacid dehydrogenase [Mycobacterium sp. Aquia_213]
MDQQAVALRVLAHFVPGDKVLDFLAAEADWLDIRWCAADDDTAFYRELPEAEVIWHVLRPLSGADLQRGERLRLVHKLGAGVNTIDVATATDCGIAVANMPGANAPSVAEGTVLLMLAALRRLPELDRVTRQGRGWPLDPELGETVRDIGGCTVGLVGYGNIAKRVAALVSAMGATVVHTSTRDDGRPGWRPLPELLAVSDIVSLHLPLTAQTHHLLNRDAIDLMKPSAVLVNTSRGAIVDEDALVGALRDGRLAAAGLDVFEVEPTASDNPLFGLDNVVLTPHVTWYTADTMRRYLVEAVSNCRRLRDGEPLANVVNQPTGY